MDCRRVRGEAGSWVGRQSAEDQYERTVAETSVEMETVRRGCSQDACQQDLLEDWVRGEGKSVMTPECSPQKRGPRLGGAQQIDGIQSWEPL